GVSRPRLARINSDGSLDTSFVHTGSGLNNFVTSLLLQSDGKVLVGGDFSSYNGVSAPRLARINSDGSLDTSFVQTGSGLNNIVNALSLQSDGKISVGGQFTAYDTQNAWHLKAFTPPNSISIGNLVNSAITQTSFTSTIGFHGDLNNNATFTLKWCNQTDNAGCTPANDATMSWVPATSTYSVNLSGFSNPNDPGDVLKLQIVVTDPDGVTGSPLNSTVTLAP
ncbi:MAG: delta-60 repeat domain-containing protein, partial [Bdellovibrionales bacterium]|nr:delta-60 repeat domain-containing protein [Bdellovibrionales bacterium]